MAPKEEEVQGAKGVAEVRGSSPVMELRSYETTGVSLPALQSLLALLTLLIPLDPTKHCDPTDPTLLILPILSGREAESQQTEEQADIRSDARNRGHGQLLSLWALLPLLPLLIMQLLLM
jgi:hypothetical protein